MMEELIAKYRVAELELTSPERKHRRDYQQLRALERMEASLKAARRRFRDAAARFA
ncbi:MAG: hypothetical protein ACM3S1_15435 [Hyphomicrobiales bacterium]